MASLGPGGPPTTAATAASPLSSLKLQFSRWGGCVRELRCVCVCVCGAGVGWGGGGGRGGLDWQPTGYSCHNIRCILSLCVQWAAERITVKWDDINYPNPDSSLWNSASTHLSQERTWMVRQRECQRNEMKADRFSREYSQQKHCSLNKVDLLFCRAFLFLISWPLNCSSISNIPLSSCNCEVVFFFSSLNILIWHQDL